MRYIFFVQEGGVTMIPFMDFLEMTRSYSDRVTSKTPLKECRWIADDLLSTYLKSGISN
jgi:hypothetical protein